MKSRVTQVNVSVLKPKLWGLIIPLLLVIRFAVDVVLNKTPRM